MDEGSLKIGVVFLIVGRVGFYDVLIDSGVVSNVIFVSIWEKLKRKGIKIMS